jgi:predicted nucleic acid-binding Zn ribbon protein
MSEDDGQLFAELDKLLSRLGSETAEAVGGVFGRWSSIVGEQIAAHVSPLRIEDGRLLVEVDDPAWATQVRFLERDIVRKVQDASGARIIGVDVRVKRR